MNLDGDISRKIEILCKNGCIKKYKEKEKSNRSLARCQSVLRNYFKFLSEKNNWKNHAFNKISTTKYDKRISNKTFKEEELRAQDRDIALLSKTKLTGFLKEKGISFLLNQKEETPLKFMLMAFRPLCQRMFSIRR